MKCSVVLKKARINLSMTQRQLADLMGYKSAQFISNIERGISQPPIKEISRMCEFLEIDPIEILDLLLDKKREDAIQSMKYKKSK